MAPEMYDEMYDESVDVYAFGMCMLEMATSEYPYMECTGPAQIYKRVVNVSILQNIIINIVQYSTQHHVSNRQGVRPQSFDKLEDPDIKNIIDSCIKLNKEERPSIKELLGDEFFAEDIGFKLEIVDRSMAVETPSTRVIKFRLRVTDQRKQRRDKPAHKEGEAIEFEFNLDQDECLEITYNMASAFGLYSTRTYCT